MKQRILSIINNIREGKDMTKLTDLRECDRLREDLGLTSFDLAELTVHIEDEFDIDIFEDGLINTVCEIYAKLQK